MAYLSNVTGPFRIAALVLLVAAAAQMVMAAPLVVNCNAGQSLNRALARLDKQGPSTVLVKGTCTEYVEVKGFVGLTLKGLPGATLNQPATGPANKLFAGVLLIESSRSVTVDGFTFHSPVSAAPNIAVGQSSIDVRLRNLTVEGGGEGIIIYEHSQVSLARVTGRDPGYSPLGVYDASDVHVEDCLFEHSTGEAWHAGIDVGSSHVTIHGTTIRNMQVGINITSGGEVDVNDFNTYFPFGGPSDVVIENPAGTNFYGVSVQGGGALQLVSAKLRVTNAGQSWGGDTSGVQVIDGSTLNAGPNLIVSGSQGHGVYVSNDSHATLDGSHIDGSLHGGLVAVNLSTIRVTSLNPPTEVGGNAVDLFCDSRSLITGAANISNASNVQCTNLLAGETEVVP